MKKLSVAILIVLLVAVLAFSLVACGDNNSDDEPVPTPDEIIHFAEYYNGLTEQEKASFDVKLNTIIASNEYNAMSDEDKISLLNRLVESEKLIKEIALENEQNAESLKNVQNELSNFSDELNYLFYSNEKFVLYFNNLIDSNISAVLNIFHNFYDTKNMTDDEIMDLLKESDHAEYYEILILRGLKEEFNADVELMKTFDINIVAEKLNAYISELNVKKGASEWDEQRGIGYVIDIIEQALKKIEANEPYCSITDVYNAIKDVKDELQEIINSGTSTAEEIATAQVKLDKVEKTEQEYVYYETTTMVRGVSANDQIFNDQNLGTTIQKIYSIYEYVGDAYINADIVKTEKIAGVEFVSRINCFIDIFTDLDDAENYAGVLDAIFNSNTLRLRKICTNKNADWHKEYWEENKFTISEKYTRYEELGYSFSIEMSWENEDDHEHPCYIMQSYNKDGEPSRCYLVKYMSDYVSDLQTGKVTPKWSFAASLTKICPEFWAQAEIENNK